MRIKIAKLYKILVLTFLILFIVFLVNGIIENFIVRKQIKDFMSRGIYIAPSPEFDYNSDLVRYYIVKKKFDYEDTKFHNYDLESNSVGTIGDIVLTNRNPLPELEFLKPIIRFFWLGHSAIVTDEMGKYIIEIVGNDSLESNEVQESQNDFGSVYNGEAVGVRIKNITDEQKEELLTVMDKYYGKKYNFLFILKLANKFYCLDLVSRILEEVDIKVNYDFWITTGSDIMVSKSTYIFYYSYVDKDGIIHKYYLE